MEEPGGGKPLYERDPVAWFAELQEGNRTQARKRVSVQVLIHDPRDRVLLVDPSYKPDWDLPGGMAESNEPPIDAARRELAEELNLDVNLERLLCVDWVAPHGPWDDLLALVFDGGTLTPTQATTMRLNDGELTRFAFVDQTQTQSHLRDYVWRRTNAAHEAQRRSSTTYTHNGHPIFTV